MRIYEPGEGERGRRAASPCLVLAQERTKITQIGHPWLASRG